MTPEQIESVRGTWKMVEPIADQAAELFYGKLFEIAPEVKPLFQGDMTEQGKKLMQMLGVAVSLLDKPGELTPALEALSQRHVGYGVEEAHYAPVGEALIWTLEQGLGDAFTEEVKAAWVAAYVALTDTMKSAVAA